MRNSERMNIFSQAKGVQLSHEGILYPLKHARQNLIRVFVRLLKVTVVTIGSWNNTLKHLK